MTTANYTTKEQYGKGRDGRNGGEFGITTATKYNRYEAKRLAAQKAAAASEANRRWMIEHGMNPNDADLLFA